MMQRFWDKVDIQDCWLWTGSLHGDGYGLFRLDGKTVRSHRVAYEMLVGEIANGLVIDHLCRTRNCVNPEHMEPVSRGENIRRGRSANREKTACPQGHAYDYTSPKGDRHCRSCRQEAKVRYRTRQEIDAI